ncbi:MAG: guanylate kinase [Deltaproteobacteria bacterium]|nr:guanylate kinase [Deltaproteobacteria bacterium]MBW2385797.1 guanylate kinase [Deltaproteobacteria bacterium]
MSGRRGIPFVVSAPSGTGKTTVCRAVVECDEQVEFSISHATRPRRPGEQDGVHFHFVSAEVFAERVAAGGFVEHAEYAGNQYGTSWESIDEPLAAGRDLLLEVEVQGARQLRSRRDDARLVFLLPPSWRELESRLRGRGTDSEEAIAKPLETAHVELAAVHQFDYAVVNDSADEATQALLAIIHAERSDATADVRERFGRARVVEGLKGVLPIPGRSCGGGSGYQSSGGLISQLQAPTPDASVSLGSQASASSEKSR